MFLTPFCRHLLVTEGVPALFKGLTPTLFGIIPTRSVVSLLVNMFSEWFPYKYLSLAVVPTSKIVSVLVYCSMQCILAVLLSPPVRLLVYYSMQSILALLLSQPVCYSMQCILAVLLSPPVRLLVYCSIL